MAQCHEAGVAQAKTDSSYTRTATKNWPSSRDSNFNIHG
jgi:hypothetical protein